MPLRVLELFSGVGTFSMALRDLGLEYKLMDSVEIDPYAVKAFNAIHGTNYEAKDITKWDNFNDGTWEKNTRIDLVTGGFPCQDISIAGKQAGIIKGKTRSGLMYEMLRVIKEAQPTWVIAENVKNILSKKHRPRLDEYISEMGKMGYATNYKVLDAKDFGVPQHRERIFIISYKCAEWEQPFEFDWPEPITLGKKLKDILEKDVDEKYYLPDSKAKKLVYKESGNVEAMLDIKGQDCVRRVYRKDGVAPTLSTMQGGQRQPKSIDDTYGYGDSPREYSDVSPTLRVGRQGSKVAIRTANTKGYDLAREGDGVDLGYPNSCTRRGRVGHGIAKTIQTGPHQGVLDRTRIRRLTPRECWRLMGYSDSDFNKAKKAGLSDSRLYKLAGNGIVLDVAKALLKEMMDA